MGLLDDKTYMVSVLRQKMLGIAPVFTYRIKQEKALDQDYLYVLMNNLLPLINSVLQYIAACRRHLKSYNSILSLYLFQCR